MSKNKLIIRKASWEDMHKIADFINSSADWYRPFVSEKDMKEHEVDETWKKKNFELRDFYVGSNEHGEDVGTISMQDFDGHTYLGYIYLDAAHVGKGYGAQLINHARDKSIAQGQESMILIAHPEATWAVRAYEKYGFEVKYKKEEQVLDFKEGIMEDYYEEGFHLYEYDLKTHLERQVS